MSSVFIREKKSSRKGGIEAEFGCAERDTPMSVRDSTQRPRRSHEWVVKLSHRASVQSGARRNEAVWICSRGSVSREAEGNERATRRKGDERERRMCPCQQDASGIREARTIHAEAARRERRSGRSRYLAAIGNNKLPSNHRSTTAAVPATAVDRPLAGIVNVWACTALGSR